MLVAINAVSSSTFAAYNSTVVGWLQAKQDLLATGSGSGQQILTGTTIRRLVVTGPHSLTANTNEIIIAIDGYTQAEVTGYLLAKQATLTVPSAPGTDILDGSLVRKLNATLPVGISETNGIITISSSAPE